ncbi:MAG: PstC family ABC transporter permease, partial [Candidatus Binatia bacterium]
MSTIPEIPVASTIPALESEVVASRISGRVNVGDRLFHGLTGVFALGLLGVLGSIVVVLVAESSVSIRTFGWNFLVTSTWDPVFKQFGALPFIYGTVVSSFLALAQAVPLGVGTAVFLSELAPSWVRAPVSFLVEFLAAIPSVIYGLWGVFVL